MYRVITALILLLFLFSGCWDRRDPELLGFVLVTAFDYDFQRDYYHIIVQMANPLAMEREEAGGAAGEKNAFWVASAYGRTPLEAMRKKVPAGNYSGAIMG